MVLVVRALPCGGPCVFGVSKLKLSEAGVVVNISNLSIGRRTQGHQGLKVHIGSARLAETAEIFSQYSN